MELRHFNIRVYALIFDSDSHRVLLSDEFQLGQRMTKFPGGGLHFGEGTLECLQREAKEEFGQGVRVIRHFYTTDFFQKALFYEDQQLISIYYEAAFEEAPRFRISDQPFDFPMDLNGSQSFRWTTIADLSAEELTFPIDRHVCSLLKIRKFPK